MYLIKNLIIKKIYEEGLWNWESSFGIKRTKLSLKKISPLFLIIFLVLLSLYSVEINPKELIYRDFPSNIVKTHILVENSNDSEQFGIPLDGETGKSNEPPSQPPSMQLSIV